MIKDQLYGEHVYTLGEASALCQASTVGESFSTLAHLHEFFLCSRRQRPDILTTNVSLFSLPQLPHTFNTANMHLMYTLDTQGKRVYTLKKVTGAEVTKSAHPARFSPDDKYSR